LVLIPLGFTPWNAEPIPPGPDQPDCQMLRPDPHDNTASRQFSNKPDKFMAMEAALIDTSRMAFHSVIVDTSSLTPDMVVGVINRNFKFEK